MKRRRESSIEKEEKLELELEINEEILAEIFLWLPLKSLVRFKKLSKRWYHLITHKESYFRRDYLSTISTRRIKRIIGTDDHAIMLGFFFQPKTVFWLSFYDRARFLITSSTDDDDQEDVNNDETSIINSFSVDEFLLTCLHHHPTCQSIFIVASSNGFLLCSLERLHPINYYIVNPVTKEWVALPKPTTTEKYVTVGFLCRGDYPSLDLVDYTIVRTMRKHLRENSSILTVDSFFSGEDQWRKFNISRPAWCSFYIRLDVKPVIMINSHGVVVVYSSVWLKPLVKSAVLVFDVTKEEDEKKKGFQLIDSPEISEYVRTFQICGYMEEFDGIINYAQCVKGTDDIELWVLLMNNSSSSSNSSSTGSEGHEWVLKHKASLKMMIEELPSINSVETVEQWKGKHDAIRIQAFHPMNPKIIYMSIYHMMMCCNIETGKLQLVSDSYVNNPRYPYNHYAYQWPCWPPLL